MAIAPLAPPAPPPPPAPPLPPADAPSAAAKIGFPLAASVVLESELESLAESDAFAPGAEALVSLATAGVADTSPLVCACAGGAASATAGPGSTGLLLIFIGSANDGGATPTAAIGVTVMPDKADARTVADARGGRIELAIAYCTGG